MRLLKIPQNKPLICWKETRFLDTSRGPRDVWIFYPAVTNGKKVE